jgi:hypothetical protein
LTSFTDEQSLETATAKIPSAAFRACIDGITEQRVDSGTISSYRVAFFRRVSRVVATRKKSPAAIIEGRKIVHHASRAVVDVEITCKVAKEKM